MDINDLAITHHPAFTDFLEDVLDRLEHPTARGVTRAVIGQGVESLSDDQAWVFENHVLDPYTVEHCRGCYHDIPWNEMLFAVDFGGVCSWCYNVRGMGPDTIAV